MDTTRTGGWPGLAFSPLIGNPKNSEGAPPLGSKGGSRVLFSDPATYIASTAVIPAPFFA